MVSFKCTIGKLDDLSFLFCHKSVSSLYNYYLYVDGRFSKYGMNILLLLVNFVTVGLCS